MAVTEPEKKEGPIERLRLIGEALEEQRKKREYERVERKYGPVFNAAFLLLFLGGLLVCAYRVGGWWAVGLAFCADGLVFLHSNYANYRQEERKASERDAAAIRSMAASAVSGRCEWCGGEKHSWVYCPKYREK